MHENNVSSKGKMSDWVDVQWNMLGGRQITIVNTQFLAIFDPRSSIVKSVFDCRLPGLVTV